MKHITHSLAQSIQQPKLGTVAYWSNCGFASMITSDRTPEGTGRVRGDRDS